MYSLEEKEEKQVADFWVEKTEKLYVFEGVKIEKSVDFRFIFTSSLRVCIWQTSSDNQPVTEYDDMKDFLQRNFVMVSFDSEDMEYGIWMIQRLLLCLYMNPSRSLRLIVKLASH